MKARKLILFLIPTLLLSSCSVIKNLINGSEVQLDNGTMMVPEEINQQSLLEVFNNCKNKISLMDYHHGFYNITKDYETLTVEGANRYESKLISSQKVDLNKMALHGNDSLFNNDTVDGKLKESQVDKEYWSCIYDDRIDSIVKIGDEYKKTSTPHANKEEAFRVNFADYNVYLLSLRIIDSYIKMISGNGNVDQFNLNADLASSDYKFVASYTFKSGDKTLNRKEEFIIKDYVITTYISEVNFGQTISEFEHIQIDKLNELEIKIPEVNA